MVVTKFQTQHLLQIPYGIHPERLHLRAFLMGMPDHSYQDWPHRGFCIPKQIGNSTCFEDQASAMLDFCQISHSAASLWKYAELLW